MSPKISKSCSLSFPIGLLVLRYDFTICKVLKPLSQEAVETGKVQAIVQFCKGIMQAMYNTVENAIQNQFVTRRSVQAINRNWRCEVYITL